MKKRMKTCAFTGHRPQNLPFGFNEEDERCIDLKKTLREQIINLIENEGVTHFISGMAIGVDMYAAEIVLGLKASYPGITLESAIPCESQAAKWSEALRDRYFDIASKCDKETLIQTHYSPDCMDKRNRYMVDHADVLIAVWDERRSDMLISRVNLLRSLTRFPLMSHKNKANNIPSESSIVKTVNLLTIVNTHCTEQ